MVMIMGEMWSNMGSIMATVMFVNAVYQQYLSHYLRPYIGRYTQKLVNIFYPFIQINFPEYSAERWKRSDVYTTIQSYLSANSSSSAKRLKADSVKDSSQSLLLSMDYNEEITDEFHGVKVWWRATKTETKSQSFSLYGAADEKRFYKLTFHARDRVVITESYLPHVLEQGKAIAVKNRQRKLYCNNPSQNWGGYKSTKWNHVVFEHPASFTTLAMEGKKKEEIMKDLVKFKQGKDYYSRIGKAWKRGYLLYGPPGTGKSSMIAAIANFMDYDVYDLELTTVKDNTELRRLLIETSNKSVIVIEDIDCSLDLTGQRNNKKKKKKKKSSSSDEEEDEDEDKIKKKMEEKEEKKDSKVTLSGLLNFIDGLWSSCGGERIIIFTTNHVDKLDPALIRRGRMDKHIEMSYCRYEAFTVLAKNYLGITILDDPLYEEVRKLLEEVDMTPADVAENLMPKSDEEEPESCLRRVIEALEEAKEEARKKKALEEEKEEGTRNRAAQEQINSVAPVEQSEEMMSSTSTTAKEAKKPYSNGFSH